MRWYWIISALCLISTVFIMAGVKDKSAKREVNVIRNEALWDISANDWSVAAIKYKGLIDKGEANAHDFFMYGLAQHYLKQFPEAIAAFRTSMNRGYPPALPTYNIACGYSLTGQKQKAIEYFHKAIELGFEDLEYFKADPDLDPIRQEPKFIAIIKNLEKNRNQDSANQSTFNKEDR